MSKSKKTIEDVLRTILESVDKIGKALMGDLWRTFYLSLQDAIALALLVKIPSAVGAVIVGKDFSSFNDCLEYDALNPTRFACFVIVD